jgi:TolB protein
MKKLIYIIIATILPQIFFAGEEIEVSLSTKEELSPVYLSVIYDEGSDFSNNYLLKLREVLDFDLHNNAFMKIVKREKQKDILLSYTDEAVSFDPEIWNNQKLRFVIKVRARNNQLLIQVYSLATQDVRDFVSTTLIGDLDVDRVKLHNVADSIQQVYFGKIGIASLHILYSVRTPLVNDKSKWISEIFMCDADGANAKKITDENGYCVHPLFFPSNSLGNDKKLLYVSYKTGQPKLYTTTIGKNQKKEKLITLRGNQLLPSISPKADKIAFISDAAGRPDLFLQYLNQEGKALGKPLQLFTGPRATQASSSFSPDGTKLAFISDKDGSPRVYVLQIPKVGQYNKKPSAHLISKKNRFNVTPSWSPDGTKLVYSAKTDGNRQIWMYNFILDEEIPLTKGRGDKENPIWAPDSLHIIYNTEEESLSELYLININQMVPVKISEGKGRKRFPSWEPL